MEPQKYQKLREGKIKEVLESYADFMKRDWAETCPCPECRILNSENDEETKVEEV